MQNCNRKNRWGDIPLKNCNHKMWLGRIPVTVQFNRFHLYSSISMLSQGIVSSICTSFNWLVSYGVSALVPPIGEAIGSSSCYFIFAGIALAGTVFIIFFVPETRGKSEEEIRDIFSGKKSTTDTELRG